MRVRVASAGTGKTTSLVLRFLELIDAGTPLRRVAGVTFTRTAAEQLRQRVGGGVRAVLDEGAYLGGAFAPGAAPASRAAFGEAWRELEGATLTTIHGFMVRTLRLAAPAMGLDPDFSVLGEWEAEAAFEEELSSLLYLARAPDHGLHEAARELGDAARPLLLALFGARSLAERFGPDEHATPRALARLWAAVYERFEVRLGATLLPPSEVERRALRLVRTPHALERVVRRYPTVLVDEFQDVNPLQGRFFELLEAGGARIEVVGDPKQSIYGFRNADVRVFRRALAEGEALPPLARSYRHAPELAAFLNAFGASVGARGRGFGAREAPPVASAGSQANGAGRIELHWVAGDAPIAELRAREAALLAERLAAAHARGVPWNAMAVLARSYAGLAAAETALGARGVPSVMLQGRGYFERTEVRDLYHALRVGVEPSGVSLAAWLRSPFGQLGLAEVDAVLRAADPVAELEARHPAVAARLERTRDAVRGTPLAALKTLIRDPLVDGRRYVDFVERRARENVDALLFTVARQPPGDLEVLLERLQLLSRQRDAGDVPQSGDGVQLLTVHRAKGLEWRLVAIFDLGRGAWDPVPELIVDSAAGDTRPALGSGPRAALLTTPDAPGFGAALARRRERSAGEDVRLLYVALSRARDELLLTGSVKRGRPNGWAAELDAMGLGPDGDAAAHAGLHLRVHPAEDLDPSGGGAGAAPGSGRAPLEPAPWLARRFRLHPHPPVQSPSRLKDAPGAAPEADAEPLPFADPDEGERLPGRAAAVGTLVHYAISQDWSASNAREMANLRAQEVMFPYRPSEQDDLLAEVAELLANYEAMLGGALPALGERDEDHPELPAALPAGATVWQGIIDRLYRVGPRWLLEDYKTDRSVEPARYTFQLATYLEAVRRVRGVEPEVRLVYLRHRRVVPVGTAALAAAWREVAEGEDAAVRGSGD